MSKWAVRIFYRNKDETADPEIGNALFLSAQPLTFCAEGLKKCEEFVELSPEFWSSFRNRIWVESLTESSVSQ